MRWWLAWWWLIDPPVFGKMWKHHHSLIELPQMEWEGQRCKNRGKILKRQHYWEWKNWTIIFLIKLHDFSFCSQYHYVQLTSVHVPKKGCLPSGSKSYILTIMGHDQTQIRIYIHIYTCMFLKVFFFKYISVKKFLARGW